MTEAQRALYDLNAKQAEIKSQADAEREKERLAFESEQVKLEEKERILAVMSEIEIDSAEKVEQILADDRLKSLSLENRQLLEKLLNEKKLLIQQNDAKKALAVELYNEVIRLESNTHNYQMSNVKALQ